MTRLPAALLIAALGFLLPVSTFAEQSASQPAASSQSVLEGVGSATGRFVVPESLPGNVTAEQVDLSKIRVTLMRELPRVPAPFPEGFVAMSDVEKQKWVQEFRASPEFAEYRNKVMQWRIAMSQQEAVPVQTEENGAFKLDDLEPSVYILRAQIPHPKSDEYAIGEYADTFEVKADEPAVELGTIELRVNSVLVPGDDAPQFTAKLYDGSEIKLSDYRGKYVLLDFWATWCGPCIAEMPNLKKVYEDFGGEEFELISLSLDDTIEKPKAFHAEKPSAYTNAYLGHWNQTETTSKDYGVRGIPSIWLIGPDGKVVARDLRGQKLRDAVSKAVGEPATN